MSTQADAQSSHPPMTSTWVAVVATTAVLTYAAMTALFPAAIAPELGRALDIPAALIGFHISIVYGGAMISSLAGGALTRRHGACRTSQIAMLLIGAGAALSAVSSVATFAFAAALIGLGYGLTNPAAAHMLMKVTPAGRRGLIFSIKQTGVPLGGVLAGAIAPALALLLGWQAALLSLTALAALGILALQPSRAAWDGDRQSKAAPSRAVLADLALVWSNQPLRYLSLSACCFSAVQLCLSVFTVALLVEELGVGLVQAGFIMSAIQIAGVGGRLVWGWLADRLRSGIAALVIVTWITIVGTLTVAAMTPSWPLLAAGAVLAVTGFAALGWNGAYLAEVAHLAPKGQVARASGGSLFFTFSGVLLGPPLFAGLHGLLDSYTQAFPALALAAATGQVLLVLARRAA